MKSRLLLVMLSIATVGAVVFAHEVTYEGTVVKYEVAKYAQPSGTPREVPELHVSIVDAESGRTATRVFVIVSDTSVLRDGKAVAQGTLASVKAGERVAVTIDHDVPGDEAITVRLGTR